MVAYGCMFEPREQLAWPRMLEFRARQAAPSLALDLGDVAEFERARS